MKGILKIYHPEETLKYQIKSSYCKALYSNQQHFLEVEIITDDSLDNVDDDSLQYQFPQLSLCLFDFPIAEAQIAGKTFTLNETDEENYTELNAFSDEDTFIYESELAFSENQDNGLELVWKGQLNDFFTETETPIDFKLKCHFKEDVLDIDED